MPSPNFLGIVNFCMSSTKFVRIQIFAIFGLFLIQFKFLQISVLGILLLTSAKNKQKFGGADKILLNLHFLQKWMGDDKLTRGHTYLQNSEFYIKKKGEGVVRYIFSKLCVFPTCW